MRYILASGKRLNIIWLLAALTVYLFVFVMSSTTTVQAFKCSGQPDDYYQRDLNSNVPFRSGDITGFADDDERALAKKTLTWNEDEGRCKIQTYDKGDTKRPTTKNGKPVCPTGYEAKSSDPNTCYRLVSRSTNDKPTYDDGTPIAYDDSFCSGVQDHYDPESFTCKESGSCNLVGTCDYNKVEMTPDVVEEDAKIAAGVKKCEEAGTTYSSSADDCNWTYDSCKKAGGTFNDTTKECKDKSDDEPEKLCSDGSKPDDKGNCPDGSNVNFSGKLGTNTTNCGQANTVIVSCDPVSKDCSGNNKKVEKGVEDGAPVIACVLRIGIQALTALIGIGAVGGIAWEALKYAKAGDNQSDTSEAKTRITEIVIGLVIYSFMLVAANWLIPGGII